MRRQPEPELMDEAEQAEAYAAADFAQPHDAFVGHFRRLYPDFGGTRVMDLGCGPADVTIRFARAYPATKILGVDGAEAMLACGRRGIAAAGLEDRIQLRRSLLPDPGLRRFAPVDAVISNSLLHHLHNPQVLWRSVAELSGPETPVFVMDLMRPQDEAATLGLVARYAADCPEVLRRDFHHSLLAAWRPEEVAGQLAEAGLGRYRVEACSDRHLIVWNPLALISASEVT